MQRLNEIGEPQLRAVAASCMGFFLKGQRTYTKDMLGRLHSLAKCKEIFQDNFLIFPTGPCFGASASLRLWALG